jgi:hypothetical protein
LMWASQGFLADVYIIFSRVFISLINGHIPHHQKVD